MAFLNIYLNYMTPKTVTYILKLGIKSYEKKESNTLAFRKDFQNVNSNLEKLKN